MPCCLLPVPDPPFKLQSAVPDVGAYPEASNTVFPALTVTLNVVPAAVLVRLAAPMPIFIFVFMVRLVVDELVVAFLMPAQFQAPVPEKVTLPAVGVAFTPSG